MMRVPLECGSPAAAFTVSTKPQIASPTQTRHSERSEESLFLQTNNNPSFPSLHHDPRLLAGAPSSFFEGGLSRSNATTSRSSLECGSPAAAFTVSTKSQIACPTETCHSERSPRSEDLCLFSAPSAERIPLPPSRPKSPLPVSHPSGLLRTVGSHDLSPQLLVSSLFLLSHLLSYFFRLSLFTHSRSGGSLVSKEIRASAPIFLYALCGETLPVPRSRPSLPLSPFLLARARLVPHRHRHRAGETSHRRL